MKSKHTFLFNVGKTFTVSRPFHAGVFVVGFNMKKAEYTKRDDGALAEYIDCDKVTFERLLYDDVYDLNKCRTDVLEAGVIFAEPVRDGCGKEVALTHCNNTVYLEEPGVYRAIYHGSGRPEAAVVFYNLE